jgi:lycopene beta-cyclase
MIIVEPRREYVNDRTWSFWAEEQNEVSHLIHQRWKSWGLSEADRYVLHSGTNIYYQQIRAIDFYEDALTCLKDKRNISFFRGAKARPPIKQADWVEIETDVGRIRADYVVDSRPRPSDTDTSKIWQVFSGGDVELADECLDPGSAQIMTNMVSDSLGLKFSYVLPQGPRHALVQTTRFTSTRIEPSQLDVEFKRDLKHLTKGKVHVRRWERGCLPMGQTPLNSEKCSRIIPAGQANGALRPATGYGFLSIQEWALGFSEAFAAGNYDKARDLTVVQKGVMDDIFLAAFLANPSQSADWFMSIAEQLSGDEFGRFISQRVGFEIWIKIMWSLSKVSFLRSICEAGFNHIKWKAR